MTRATSLGALLIAASAFVTPSYAFFKVNCDNPIIQERADPIINPGTFSSHTHTISGGGNFSPNMTYADARKSTCGSCEPKADMSNYWTPQLYFQWANGSFTSVDQTGGTLIYYLYRTDPADTTKLTAFPEGFKMLSGNPMLRSFNATSKAQSAVAYTCYYDGTPEQPDMPARNCPGGLRAHVRFPSCWDGENVYKSDQSHMAFGASSTGETGVCPSTHPVRLPTLNYEVLWSVDPWNNFRSQAMRPDQPFVFAMGDPLGYGFHGDFFMGWDRDILQSALDTCMDGGGDISMCPVLETYDRSVSGECHKTPDVDEVVLGTLDTLPGCNPVTFNDADAIAGMKSCPNATAPTLFSNPVSYTGSAPPVGSEVLSGSATVLTSYGEWKYLDCYSDVTNPRPFPNGISMSSTTVENCLDGAKAAGYKYAGIEYGRECWAGNSIPSGSTAIGYGKCGMSCDGNSEEYCGGPNALTLYELGGSMRRSRRHQQSGKH